MSLFLNYRVVKNGLWVIASWIRIYWGWIKRRESYKDKAVKRALPSDCGFIPIYTEKILFPQLQWVASKIVLSKTAENFILFWDIPLAISNLYYSALSLFMPSLNFPFKCSTPLNLLLVCLNWHLDVISSWKPMMLTR